MSLQHLADKLRAVWTAAPNGDRVVLMHLFGIEHAKDLGSLRLKELKALASHAGLSPEYGTELRKMVRLAEYVQIVRHPI